MTISVRKNLIPQSKYPLKAPYPMVAEYITVHNTANDVPADNEVRFMVGNSSSTSFHFAIDDFEVVQGVPVDRNAFHCGDSRLGDGNRKSIGVEICYSEIGGERYKKAEALASKFVAQLLHERNWGIERVRTHKSWTEIGVKKGYSSYVKNCPHRILDEGRWNSFLATVKSELAKLIAPESAATYTVAVGDTLWSISQKFKISVSDIKEWNGLATDTIHVGQELRVNGPIPTLIPKPEAQPVEQPKAPSSGSAIVPFPGVLKRGSKGNEVERLQRALGIKADSVFGPATENAVKTYQSRHGLVADGIVGLKTWNTIF